MLPKDLFKSFEISRNLRCVRKLTGHSLTTLTSFCQPVCFKKRKKIVPDQLLVTGLGTSEEPEGFQTDSK